LSFLCLFLLLPSAFSLFPYTTLFRSVVVAVFDDVELQVVRLTVVRVRAIVSEVLVAYYVGVPFDHIGIVVAKIDAGGLRRFWQRSEEHTSELQSHLNLVCRLLLEKKK